MIHFGSIYTLKSKTDGCPFVTQAININIDIDIDIDAKTVCLGDLTMCDATSYEI